MGQLRATLGLQYEKQFCYENPDWMPDRKNPKLYYPGEGRSVHKKIKNLNYDVTKFELGIISSTKHDLRNIADGRIAEFKGYQSSKCYKPTLYCEFFKVATRNQQYIHDVKTFNKFLDEFYTYNLNNGFFEKLETGLMSSIDGIQLLDVFVPKCNLIFECKIIPGWAQFNRFALLFHIK